jgi:hypothetical protein
MFKEMMEGNVARLCDTKSKTCAMMKDNDDALKQKGLSSQQQEDMVVWHAWHKNNTTNFVIFS